MEKNSNNKSFPLPLEFNIFCIQFGVVPDDMLQKFKQDIILPSHLIKTRKISLISELATRYAIEYTGHAPTGLDRYSTEQMAAVRQLVKDRNALLKSLAGASQIEKLTAQQIFFQEWLIAWADY